MRPQANRQPATPWTRARWQPARAPTNCRQTPAATSGQITTRGLAGRTLRGPPSATAEVVEVAAVGNGVHRGTDARPRPPLALVRMSIGDTGAVNPLHVEAITAVDRREHLFDARATAPTRQGPLNPTREKRC